MLPSRGWGWRGEGCHSLLADNKSGPISRCAGEDGSRETDLTWQMCYVTIGRRGHAQQAPQTAAAPQTVAISHHRESKNTALGVLTRRLFRKDIVFATFTVTYQLELLKCKKNSSILGGYFSSYCLNSLKSHRKLFSGMTESYILTCSVCCTFRFLFYTEERPLKWRRAGCLQLYQCCSSLQTSSTSLGISLRYTLYARVRWPFGTSCSPLVAHPYFSWEIRGVVRVSWNRKNTQKMSVKAMPLVSCKPVERRSQV